MEIDNKITGTGIMVWLSCALFFMYEFLLRTVLGTYETALTTDLNLTPFTFSFLSTTGYSLVYGLMQIPVGIITLKIGVKRSLLIAALFCGMATLGFAFSNQFYFSIMCRVIMGFGSSFGFVCLLISVYDWMPKSSIAFYIGLSQFIGTIGPMTAAGPLYSIFPGSQWRTLFITLSGVGFFMIIMILAFVKENRTQHNKFIILSQPKVTLNSILSILKQKQIWYIAFFSSCVYFSVEFLSENTGVEFLITKGLSANFSAYMITLAWLGYAMGCPLLGFISDKIKRRKPILIMTSLLSVCSLSVIIYWPLSHDTAIFFFFLLGISASGQSIGFAIIAEQCKKEHLGSTLGLNNAMIGLLSATGAPLIGAILSHSYDFPNYNKALFVLIIFATIASCLAILGIRETFCKSEKESTILFLKSAG